MQIKVKSQSISVKINKVLKCYLFFIMLAVAEDNFLTVYSSRSNKINWRKGACRDKRLEIHRETQTYVFI